jgi:hypothetical protein
MLSHRELAAERDLIRSQISTASTSADSPEASGLSEIRRAERRPQPLVHCRSQRPVCQSMTRSMAREQTEQKRSALRERPCTLGERRVFR